MPPPIFVLVIVLLAASSSAFAPSCRQRRGFASRWLAPISSVTPARTSQQSVDIRAEANDGGPPLSALPTPEESARQLTEFMAKAHEEKLRALKLVEEKYRAEISDLKERLERYENQDGSAMATTRTRHNSFEFPATNKEMSEKIRAYQTFVANYVVRSQKEKLEAVATAEAKMKETYEAIISELTRKVDDFKP